jgi:hypothetical protein
LPRWTGRGRGEMCATGRRVRSAAGSVGRAGSCGSCPRRSGVRGGAVRPGCGQRPRPGFRWRGGRSARRVRRRAVAPGDRGWVHFLVTMRRCQRSSVPGVTIRCRRKPFGSIRDNAASTARSVHSSRGFGFTRRSTATSWRRTSISAFFDADDRASSASQDSTATANRQIRLTCTMPHHRRSEPVTEFRTHYRPGL